MYSIRRIFCQCVSFLFSSVCHTQIQDEVIFLRECASSYALEILLSFYHKVLSHTRDVIGILFSIYEGPWTRLSSSLYG